MVSVFIELALYVAATMPRFECCKEVDFQYGHIRCSIGYLHTYRYVRIHMYVCTVVHICACDLISLPYTVYVVGFSYVATRV